MKFVEKSTFLVDIIHFPLEIANSSDSGLSALGGSPQKLLTGGPIGEQHRPFIEKRKEVFVS